MAACDFGQVDVGLEADFFELRHLLGRQGVVEILGHRVGIAPQAAAHQARRAQPQAAHAVARAMHQVAGELALLDLLADILGIVGFEDVVQKGEHRAQCQSHG